MSTPDQNQTVTMNQNGNELDLQTIDTKFMEIKNRLKEQHEGSIKKQNFSMEFQMEQTSEFDKKNEEKLNETHYNQAIQKFEIIQKKVLSEVNGNIQASQSEYEYSVIDDGNMEKENKKILPSYQSSQKNILGTQKKIDIQKASENEPFSAIMRESEYSKISQTFVIVPRKGEKQQISSYQRNESDLHSRVNLPLQMVENVSVNDSRINQSKREQNSIKYNYMNEQIPSFKDLMESNQNYSDIASSHCEAYQLAQKFQQILNSQEVSQLNNEDKKDYINFLKKEISVELMKESQYKQMQEEASLLNKNFKLEKELYQTEQDNRKLQIWILEDKKKQVEAEYDVKLKEKSEFNQQLHDLQSKKDQTISKQNQINQLINSTHFELENLKKYQSKSFEQKESFNLEQQQLQTELQGEQQLLNQLMQNNQNITKIFDQNSLKVQKSLKMIQEYQNSLQYKETSIFGFKKEIKRIEDDIIEANQIKGTIKEEKDMFETQLSFLQKQKNILERDIENLKKKKKFEEEFIHYGDKNNHQLFDMIKQNKHFIDKFQQENQMKIKENKLQSQKNEMAQKQIQQTQILISQIEQNINQIVEVTQFQDELFKDPNRFEETKTILMRLCKKNFSQDQYRNSDQQNYSKNSQINQTQQSFSKDLPKIEENLNESRQKQKLNIKNMQEIFSASLSRKNIQQVEDLDLDEQPTKRVLSEKGTSSNEVKSGNSIGFMGLGKSFNQQIKAKNINRCQSQDEIEENEFKAPLEEPVLVSNNQNDLKQKLNLKNIDKISKITDHQKMQSPFTVRSILGTQNENCEEYRSSNRYQQNQNEFSTQIPQNNRQTKSKMADLKLFLTAKGNENQSQMNLNQQQERLQNMVNQIKSCSPLKQVNQALPNRIFSEKDLIPSASKSNFSNKQSINSKSQEKSQEMIKFMEIQKKNELIKNGQIKQMIYLNDSVINQQPEQKIVKKKKVLIKSMAHQDFEYNQYQDQFQDNIFIENNPKYIQYQDQNQMVFIKKNKSQTQDQDIRKKSIKKQFKTVQTQQDDLIQIEDYQREFPEFQIVNQNEDNIIFTKSQQFSRKSSQNQQAVFGQRAEPFRKRSVSPAQYSDNSNERPVFAQAVKMTILKGFLGEDADSKQDKMNYQVDYRHQTQKDSFKNPQFFQRNPYSRDVSQEKNQRLELDQKTLNKKNTATASKQDLLRQSFPSNFYIENKKFQTSSLVETDCHEINRNSVWNKVKVAPLRKSTSQRREEQNLYEQKSETQSQIYQLSSIQSTALHNKDNKNIINKRFDQISVQSQQVADIPPIPGKILKAQKRYEKEINLNEINIKAVQNINREIEQSQKTTRTQYVVGNKNQLTQNGYIQENFNDNEFQRYNKLPPKHSYDQNSLKYNQSDQMTFKKSTHSQNGNVINNDTFAQKNQFDLNLKSKFAQKTLEISGADNKNVSREKYSPLNSKQDRQLHPCSIVDQDSHTNTSYQINQDSRRFAAIPQSAQSIHNTSIYGEIQIKQVQNIYQQPKSYETINQFCQNKDQIFQLQSPDHNSKNGSNVLQFTPFYKNNYNQSGVKTDNFQNDSVYQNFGQQLNLRSNFAKNKFENSQLSQRKQIITNEFVQDGPQQFQQQNLKVQSLQSSPSTKQSIYPNQNNKMNEECLKNESKAQNQNKLSKMQQELQILKSQISEGMKPSYTQSLIEPGNQEIKNRDFLQNENCFSDLYIEQINLNSDRLDEMAPIDYQMKESNLNDALKQNLNTISSQTLNTQVTKQIMDNYYINQDKNIKVSQQSGDFQMMNNHDDGMLQQKFRQLKEDLNIDDRISEYENESVNTYVSLKDQSDIISQLRSCKLPIKKY